MAGLKKGMKIAPGGAFKMARGPGMPPPTTTTAQPKMSRQSGSAKPPTMPIQTLKNQTKGPVPKGAKARTPAPGTKFR